MYLVWNLTAIHPEVNNFLFLFLGAINDIECTHSHHRHHARGTAYYPADDPIEGGFVDMRDHPLMTLQVFLQVLIHNVRNIDFNRIRIHMR